MNTRCPFDPAHLSFSGSPLDQAKCLLRFVKRGGDVDDVSTSLPNVLATLLASPQSVDVSVTRLRDYLQKHGIPENTAGGSLDAPVCRADTNNPSARLAQYFVIHDTSFKLNPGQTFDPAFINTLKWNGNRISTLPRKKTHLFVTRLGETLMDNDYGTPFRATQFELQPDRSIPGAPAKGTILRGLCLHHELVQPRLGPGKSDIESPNPGFTQVQYERLALQYLIASVRRGSWMVPAFHCVLDLHIGDHDDPQRFDLAAWGVALEAMRQAVLGTGHGGTPLPPPPPLVLSSPLLAGDPVLVQVAAGNQVLAQSATKADGVGTLQDALNLLADHGETAVNIPGARNNAPSRGFFGKQTLAAVLQFQANHGVSPADGTVGRDTIGALARALAAVDLPDDTQPLAGEKSRETGETEEKLAGTVTGHFTTPKADARTADGKGGSTTTGLEGDITQEGGVETIEATETLTAFRDGHSLGAQRTVRQVRTKQNGVTVVQQPDYCWMKRVLPDAHLTDAHGGLSGGDVFTGKATFFGKSDSEDEGTGTGAYGLVQTNSSVFGISLKRARLLAEGLATEDSSHILHPTPKGLSARVEVFFPDTGRGALLPLVDVGPGNSGPARTAVADLTVAASVYLQKLTEDELTKPHQGNIDNIQVKLRIMA